MSENNQQYKRLYDQLLSFVQELHSSNKKRIRGGLWCMLVLPVVSFCVGLSLGKRRGLCPLYPVACLICCLPVSWWLARSFSTPPIYCLMSVIPGGLGNLGGWLWRRRKSGKTP